VRLFELSWAFDFNNLPSHINNLVLVVENLYFLAYRDSSDSSTRVFTEVVDHLVEVFLAQDFLNKIIQPSYGEEYLQSIQTRWL
jgi:hypothetical protein